jgi:hypothetical protein
MEPFKGDDVEYHVQHHRFGYQYDITQRHTGPEEQSECEHT